MKKLNTFLALILVSTCASFAQDFESTLSTPGEEIEYNYELPQDEVKTFTEYSIGVMYMPIPLFINEINVTQDGTTTELTAGDNIVNSGFGLALNADFTNSGKGLGFFAYGAIIGGDNVRAYDYFGAFKYDFALGDPLTTNFEISPTVGIGNIDLQQKESELYYGSSLYFSGGARITWRISNVIFFGGDVLLSPLFFNPEKLLGVEDMVDEAEIKYKSPVTVNFSLRFNILN